MLLHTDIILLILVSVLNTDTNTDTNTDNTDNTDTNTDNSEFRLSTYPSHTSASLCFVSCFALFVQVRDHLYSNSVTFFLTIFFTPTCIPAPLYLYRYFLVQTP